MKNLICLLFLIVFNVNIKAQESTDSIGIYAVIGEKIEPIQRITHVGIKGSGGLGSALSFGLSPVKAKYEFKGATSDHVFDKVAIIRIYFGQPPI